MAKQYDEISDEQRVFIEDQKLFFVGTATADSRINISPKGMDSLRVIDQNRVAWLNVTGSGNETAAHVQTHPRMTLMFAAFEGAPMILRLYGTARVIHVDDADWDSMFSLFTPLPGARQIFDLQIDLVQTSCGFGVPLYDFREGRGKLKDWALKRGEDGVRDYWALKNQVSLDGEETHIIKKSA